MNVNTEELEAKATHLYCSLAEIEDLIEAFTLAARDEEERHHPARMVSWPSLLGFLKREVTSARELAEANENDLRHALKVLTDIGGDHAA